MTLNEVYQKAKANGQHDICRFMRDMRRAGIRVRYYRGRYYWTGPAADVDSIDEALQATKVQCRWDNMGKGYVVYPRQGL